jgi:hypothetical protein
MNPVRTFSIAATLLALTAVASPAASRQDATSDGHGDQIASFRTEYNNMMDRYDSIFRKLGNARGLRMTAQGRDSLRMVGDDQLAAMFQTGGVPDLRPAVEAAARLEAVTPSRGSDAPSPASDTPGFPGAPPILSQCDNISHSSSFTFGALVAFQVLRTIIDAAEFGCEQIAVVAGFGANTAAVCIPLAIAADVAVIPYELADFCGGEEDSAIGQGSYDRLEHIHTDLENVKSDIIASINANTQLIINNDNANRELIINNDNANRDIILTAMANLSCDIERLLHTPEGQRQSDIAECKGQSFFPYDFPIHP